MATLMDGRCVDDALQRFLTAVFQHESGIPGNYNGKAKRGFSRLANSGTQLDFPQFEKVRVARAPCPSNGVENPCRVAFSSLRKTDPREPPTVKRSNPPAPMIFPSLP